MKVIAKTFIYGGISAVLLASMAVDETYAPMTNEEFMLQMMLIVFGIGATFIGFIMHSMAE